ncbi:MAG TPA: hypothetical protein VGQ10_12795 [Vicinamibacterales bacterium]|jgi:hypothetical protein|nr:hypothetical protein [Vicinamibacterales bacterium]
MLLVTALSFAPFLGGGMLTDDFVHLSEARKTGGLARSFTTPDPFGFYRPLPQLSFALESSTFGHAPVLSRTTNLVLHLAVLCAAFLLARLLLGTDLAAFLATLAFALTPKAHPIAVLWISARSELLMALFSMLAVSAWIAWDRGGRPWLLGAAAICYLLAFLSKETAVLLPMLLLITPTGHPLFAARRLVAAGAIAAIGVAVFAWRTWVGALVPISLDPHYNLATPMFRWSRNARNYLWRALPSPAALLAVAGLTMWKCAGGVLRRGVAGQRSSEPAEPRPLALALYAAAWFVVFIAPVLPIVARSELYLYLPGFGFCLFAGCLVQRTIDNAVRFRPAVVAVAVYVAALGGYQISRSAALHQDLSFSATFVSALADSKWIATNPGPWLLVPDDAVTERFLRDAIGGYLDVVLKRSLGLPIIGGAIAYPGEPRPAHSGLIACVYRDGQVRLRHAGAE